jgi:integrase/recombinase XerD
MAYNDPESALENLTAKMMGSNINKENKKAIKEHIAWLRANGSNVRTIIKHLYHLERFLNVLDKSVAFDTATRRDIEKAMAKIETSHYANETKSQIKFVLKAFYKHRLGEDLSYPKIVAWIKATKSSKRVLPEDILTEEEIIKMIGAANNDRDKAITALLFDSGVRIGELMTMRVKDIDLSGNLAHITVNGKTGMRRIPIMFSVSHVSKYMEVLKNPAPEDPLWRIRWDVSKVPMDYSGIRKMLKISAERAGIKKRIYPHLFRHSRASYYANRMTEQQLKVFFGWAGGSTMVATYVHLSGKDIDNAILQANGEKTREEVYEPKLKVIPCPRCRENNGPSSRFCIRCGSPLDIATALKEEELAEDGKEILKRSIVDKKIDDKVVAIGKDRKSKKVKPE